MMPANKGMKLSERGSLGGDCSPPAGVIESRSAAYAQCYMEVMITLHRLSLDEWKDC